jgi:Ca-activated chloride channel family protein
VTGQDPIPNADSQSSAPTPAPKKLAKNSAVIVLLTDGENNVNPDPLAAAQLAADRGVRIHTIAIGSVEGVNLTVNGFTVHTKVDEAALQQIASITDGLYFNAKTEADLRKIYDSIEPRLVIDQDKTEVTAVFAGLSILILLIGGMLSLLWFSHVP